MEAKSKQNRFPAFLAALIVFALIKLLLPATKGLTQDGVTFLAVFVSTIILLMVCKDCMFPCFYALGMMGAMNLVNTANIFTASYGSTTCAIMIAVFVITYAMDKTGLTEYIAKWFLSRPSIKGHPYTFLAYAILAEIVISAFIDPFMAIFSIMPIGKSILERLGFTKKHNVYKAFLMTLLWLPGFVQLIFPFGKSMTLLMEGYATGFGYSFDLGAYVAMAGAICLAISAASILIFALLCKPEKDKFNNYDPEEIKSELLEKPLTKQGKFVAIIVFVTFICLAFPYFGAFGVVSDYMAKWSSIIPYYLAVILLACIPIEGHAVVEPMEAALKINWPMVMMPSVIMMFSSFVGKEEFGVTAWISNMLSPVTQSVSPAVLLLVAVCAVIALTNITSNMATLAIGVTIFTPVFIGLYNSGESFVHPVCVIIGLSIGANISYLLPSCAPAPAAIYGSGDLSIKESLPCNIAAVFVGIAIVYVGIILFSVAGIFA